MMENLLNRIAALRMPVKLAIMALLPALVAGGYYWFFYGDILDERGENEKSIVQVSEEKKAYEVRKREYLAFRNEVNQLLEEQKELLRVLPKRDDIEQFIESVNSQIELCGLSKVSSVRDKAIPEEMYLRIPIRMSLVGTYHQINRFFKNIGELQRIVTIADLQLSPAGARNANEAGPLKADFVAQTFQFLDEAAKKANAQKAAAAAKKGGGGAK